MKFKVLAVILIFVCCSVVVFAQKNKEIPPWMEEIKKNGKSVYLVPKGAKRRLVGAQIIVESPNEYVARRLYEMEGYLEERFKRIERNQERLREEFGALKKIVEELQSKAVEGEGVILDSSNL